MRNYLFSGPFAEHIKNHIRLKQAIGYKYYHCAEHIHKVANVHYGQGTEQSLEWLESTMCRLFYAEVTNVIRGLRNMKPTNDEAAEEIRKLISYLNKNKKRIHYRGDRIGGYPKKIILHSRL
jgi:hypothetical protein